MNERMSEWMFELMNEWMNESSVSRTANTAVKNRLSLKFGCLKLISVFFKGGRVILETID